MSARNRWLLALAILGSTVGCDQGTKVLARETLQGAPEILLLAGTVRLVYAENPGAFLSLGAGLDERVRFVVFTAFVALMIAGIFVYAVFKRELDLGARVAYLLLVAGGLGNLVDRVMREGTVIDFVQLGVGPVRTGVFNVADVAIVAGVAVHLLASRRPGATPKESAPT